LYSYNLSDATFKDYDETNRETLKKNVEKRFGKDIKFESYRVSNTINLITIIIGIFLIPLQLFLEGFMKKIEDPWIIDI